MSMTALAKLPGKWREEAGYAEINALEADSIGLHDAAKSSDRRAKLLAECADELEAALSPAELGGVEDAELAEVIADLRELAEVDGWICCGVAADLLESRTTPRAAEAEKRAPSYDALLLIAQSVCGALNRSGIDDCDDPGEAIDVLRESYENRLRAKPKPDYGMAVHWIERYAAGVDDELQLDRVCEALGVAEPSIAPHIDCGCLDCLRAERSGGVA